MGVSELLATLVSQTTVPERHAKGAFIFAVDHCFPIKGQV